VDRTMAVRSAAPPARPTTTGRVGRGSGVFTLSDDPTNPFATIQQVAAAFWSSSPWPPPDWPCSSACWQRRSKGAGAFSYILLLLIFINPSFVPTDSMTPLLRGVAENQPMTPIIETMRSVLTDGTPGPDIWVAVAWAAGILIVSYTLALGIYRRSAPVPAAQ
jgi:hypothetical protein